MTGEHCQQLSMSFGLTGAAKWGTRTYRVTTGRRMIAAATAWCTVPANPLPRAQ